MNKIILFVLLLCISFCFASENIEKEKTMLKITDFIENSNLEKAGARIGDFVLKYNGVNVRTIQSLTDEKEKDQPANVIITILRDIIVQNVSVPKGQLGELGHQQSKKCVRKA